LNDECGGWATVQSTKRPKEVDLATFRLEQKVAIKTGGGDSLRLPQLSSRLCALKEESSGSEEFDEKEGIDISEGDHMHGFHGEDDMEGGLEHFFIGDEEEVESSDRSFDDDDEGEEKFGKLMELPPFTGKTKPNKKKAARCRKKRAADMDVRDAAMLELAEEVGDSICASRLDFQEKDVAKRGLLLGSMINEEVKKGGLGLGLSEAEGKAVATIAASCIARKRHDPMDL
jgi:hypothetical protein